MAVAGLFFDGTPLPMIAGIAVCAVIAFVIAQVTLGNRGAPTMSKPRFRRNSRLSEPSIKKAGRIPGLFRTTILLGAEAQPCSRSVRASSSHSASSVRIEGAAPARRYQYSAFD